LYTERETLASVTRNTLHFLPSISISYLVKMMEKLKENKQKRGDEIFVSNLERTKKRKKVELQMIRTYKGNDTK
jgi:uncharacterized membrane protein